MTSSAGLGFQSRGAPSPKPGSGQLGRPPSCTATARSPEVAEARVAPFPRIGSCLRYIKDVSARSGMVWATGAGQGSGEMSGVGACPSLGRWAAVRWAGPDLRSRRSNLAQG